MNALTKTDAGIPRNLPMPVLSGSLRAHLAGPRRYGGDSDDDPGFVVQTRMVPGTGDIAEAKRKLPEIEALCRPADPSVIRVWLLRLNVALAWPLAQTEFAAQGSAVAAACADLPRVAWTEETVLAASAHFERWPGAARLRAFLQERVAELLTMRDGLRRVAEHAPAMPVAAVEPPPDPARIREIAAQAKAELATGPAARGRNVAKPALLSDGALLAEYDRLAAEGDTRAATRAAQIRRALTPTSPAPRQAAGA